MKLKNLDSKMKCSRKVVNNLVNSYTNASSSTLIYFVNAYIDRNEHKLNMSKKERVDILHYHLNNHFTTVREFINYCCENYFPGMGWDVDGVNDLELN